jgi:ribosomal protein L30/L7E
MLVLFFYTTSISKTARLLGINNITCRSHLWTIVNRLLSQGHNDIYNMFKYIMGNLNKIKKYVDA